MESLFLVPLIPAVSVRNGFIAAVSKKMKPILKKGFGIVGDASIKHKTIILMIFMIYYLSYSLSSIK